MTTSTECGSEGGAVEPSLLQGALADGFLILLLGIERRFGPNVCRCAWRLYDGGRIKDRGDGAATDPDALAELAVRLRKVVLPVVAPPHVLAGFGRGWKAALAEFVPAQVLSEMRVLDLQTVASLIADPSRPARDWDDLARYYAVAGADDAEEVLGERHEAILWAVLERAGDRGLTWPRLLSLPEDARPRVSFDGYAFAQETISALPSAPGVYEMYDNGGRLLYVGKSANLARRLGEYFRPSWQPTPKVARIRERIRRFAYQRVGSELEALLVEDERIQALDPALNVQRKIAEGRGRYGELAGAVVVVMPSVESKCAEVFFFGGDRRQAVQVRIRFGQPPVATLRSVCAWYEGIAPRLRRTRAVRSWGPRGSEICGRYFYAHRERLHWCEVPPGRPEAYMGTLLDVFRRAHDEGFDPAEVRFTDDEQGRSTEKET